MLHRGRRHQRGSENYQQKMRRNRLREKLPERSIDTNAPLMGAQIMLRKEECARGTGQRPNNMNALLMGVRIKQ
jgi:hypothetical protein